MNFLVILSAWKNPIKYLQHQNAILQTAHTVYYMYCTWSSGAESSFWNFFSSYMDPEQLSFVGYYTVHAQLHMMNCNGFTPFSLQIWI